MTRLRRALVLINNSHPTFRSRCFKKPSPSLMPRSLTREMFISPDYVKVAATQPTMFKATADGNGISEVPIPASVTETGTIPDGYSVDFILDPSIVLAVLKKRNIDKVGQLSAEAMKEIKDTLNAPENLMIIPTLLHAQKLALGN